MWFTNLLEYFFKPKIITVHSNEQTLISQRLRNKVTELTLRIELLEAENERAREQSQQDTFLIGTKVQVINNNLFGLEGRVVKTNSVWVWFEIYPGVIKRRMRHNLISIE